MNHPPVAHGEFLACDWGTSALRLHLVAAGEARPLAGVESTNGIGVTHRAWQAAGASAASREGFYLATVRRQVANLAAATSRSLDGVPVVMSGMATATIGLREVAYQELPFALDGVDLRAARLAASAGFPHPVLLISGARVTDDVMRGEETQLIGAAALKPGLAVEALVILPGTHSKHVRVRDGRAISLRTYMTGEFFDLLAHRSLLANSVEDGASCPTLEAAQAFAEGVQRGAVDNLLHAGFGVRVAQISGMRDKPASHHYLSGLLIGAELGGLRAERALSVSLVGRSGLTTRYQEALRVLGWSGEIVIVGGEAAVIAGQRVIAMRQGFLI